MRWILMISIKRAISALLTNNLLVPVLSVSSFTNREDD